MTHKGWRVVKPQHNQKLIPACKKKVKNKTKQNKKKQQKTKKKKQQKNTQQKNKTKTNPQQNNKKKSNKKTTLFWRKFTNFWLCSKF